jgi:cytochrome c553
MSIATRIGGITLGLLMAASIGAQEAAQQPRSGEAALAADPIADPHAAGDAKEGATKAAVCSACHGMNGNSTNPEWPSLAGQPATYTAEQLKLFREGLRPNPVMAPLAMPLTDEDIADLSVYFEAQTPQGHEADPSYWKAGEALYWGGDATRQIPACAACHGPVGRGNPAAGFPAVRAQHAVYTIKQLKDYTAESRYQRSEAGTPSRHGDIMVTISKRLSEEDIRNVASYIQGMR